VRVGELVLLREEGCVDLPQSLRHERQGDVRGVAREAVDGEEVGQVLGPRQGGIVDDGDQVGLAEEAAERLCCAVKGGVPG
jgi:hypothetical protein